MSFGIDFGCISEAFGRIFHVFRDLFFNVFLIYIFIVFWSKRAPISCQGALPFWLLFFTLSARVPFYDPCVVSASILAPFGLNFGSLSYLVGSILHRNPSFWRPNPKKTRAYHRKDPLRKNSSFQGHLGIIVLEQPQKKNIHLAQRTSPALIFFWQREDSHSRLPHVKNCRNKLSSHWQENARRAPFALIWYEFRHRFWLHFGSRWVFVMFFRAWFFHVFLIYMFIDFWSKRAPISFQGSLPF